MPLFFSCNLNEHTRLAVWHLTEPLDFFLQKVGVLRNIVHPHKKLQHAGGRFLLTYLFEDFPISMIAINDANRPFLPEGSHYFSISHCGDYAAAIVSTEKRVGIDIEIPTPRVSRIVPKFLTSAEQMLLPSESDTSYVQRAILLWSIKEALYKWYSLGGVDFKLHLQITSIAPSKTNNMEGLVTAFCKKNEPILLHLPYKTWNNLVLTWVIG